MSGNTKFYTFSQNNSGGSFDYDEDSGVTHYVIVEASDKNHAISRAEEIGLYWDGCNAGRDCDCCGDRWSAYDAEDGEETPKIYDQDVRSSGGFNAVWGKGWMKEGREVCVHPISGEKEWYGVIK